jgi:hypothetical protein
MSLANLSRSVGAGLFSLFAKEISNAGSFYLMAGLLLGAALLLRWFDPQKHKAAIEAL